MSTPICDAPTSASKSKPSPSRADRPLPRLPLPFNGSRLTIPIPPFLADSKGWDTPDLPRFERIIYAQEVLPTSTAVTPPFIPTLPLRISLTRSTAPPAPLTSTHPVPRAPLRLGSTPRPYDKPRPNYLTPYFKSQGKQVEARSTPLRGDYASIVRVLSYRSAQFFHSARDMNPNSSEEKSPEEE